MRGYFSGSRVRAAGVKRRLRVLLEGELQHFRVMLIAQLRREPKAEVNSRSDSPPP